MVTVTVHILLSINKIGTLSEFVRQISYETAHSCDFRSFPTFVLRNVSTLLCAYGATPIVLCRYDSLPKLLMGSVECRDYI